MGAGVDAHESPKIANIFLHWSVTDAEARELSKWDVVILDAENGVHNPERLRLMRELNPMITLLAYVPASEIRTDLAALGSSAPVRSRIAARIRDEWWLTDTAGNRRSFWIGNQIMNVTSPWQDALPVAVRDEVLSAGVWDGVFYDNAWENISYFGGTGLDLNRDGSAESVRDADAAWRAGLQHIYRKSRELFGDRYLVTANDGPLYIPDVQGMALENFPRGGFIAIKNELARVRASARPPRIAVVNANTRNSGARDDYARFRFGLMSTLLEDGYYSWDFGDEDHGQTWYYDEYDAPLGAARGRSVKLAGTGSPGVWRRDFDGGSVFVNATAAARTIRFGGGYEKLRGTQDPATNAGGVVDAVTIPPEDGIILLRPLGAIVGAVFPNSSFVRILNPQGESVRTGFFVLDDRVPVSSVALMRDFGRDGRHERVFASGNTIEVQDADGRRLGRIQPFGPRFRGALAFAVGDLDGDGRLEIVAGAASGGAPEISVWNARGERQGTSFFAFDRRFRGGLTLAVADLDGDGRGEIIVGAGSGGAPEVKTFTGAGLPRGPGFLAYGPRFRGGVRVAAADLDGDGRAEIVTGAGPGGGPHVRVFDAVGRPQSEFFPFDPQGSAGVFVSAADLDGDGRAEIFSFANSITP